MPATGQKRNQGLNTSTSARRPYAKLSKMAAKRPILMSVAPAIIDCARLSSVPQDLNVSRR